MIVHISPHRNPLHFATNGSYYKYENKKTSSSCRVSYVDASRKSYGAGEYYVAVVSSGTPSRFALRVSAATAQDEISMHMRAAAAIVDNLAIMSNMDPHVRISRE